MTLEEESVNFLKHHIDNSFNHILRDTLIEDIEWLEQPHYRPIAYLMDDNSEESNLICLFPPMIPTGKA